MDELADRDEGPDTTDRLASLATRLLPGNPLRPVDWRWERAGQLLEPGVRRRRWDDYWVSRTRRFRGTLDRARGHAGGTQPAPADSVVFGASQL
jgi:hypothetical protein